MLDVQMYAFEKSYEYIKRFFFAETLLVIPQCKTYDIRFVLFSWRVWTKTLNYVETKVKHSLQYRLKYRSDYRTVLQLNQI